jgi:sterol desaturase/sphingolipid hydroxylase (fatty acid hydroxylase superfamily)
MPDLFVQFFASLQTMPVTGVTLWAVLENLIILFIVLLMGRFLVHRYQNHRVTQAPEPLTSVEIGFAASCVFLNTVVTITGVLLWQSGIIHVRFNANILMTIADTVILFFAMDFAMYQFHRIAHHPRLYPVIHLTHHRFENPRPLTLFVLNPFETLGFGTLWLLVLAVYPAAWLSIILYLTLNIVFGLVGHLGVEPMPNQWINLPLVRYISTSTFHAEHHVDKAHNYGFYTLIWDRLFGTLSPDYVDDFQSAHRNTPIGSP